MAVPPFGKGSFIFLQSGATATATVVWLYYRFNLSHRDIEDLLAERGITVSREAVRLWFTKFGAIYTLRLKGKHRGYGDTLFIDEVFARIKSEQPYQWRAIDQGQRARDAAIQINNPGAGIRYCPCCFP